MWTLQTAKKAIDDMIPLFGIKHVRPIDDETALDIMNLHYPNSIPVGVNSDIKHIVIKLIEDKLREERKQYHINMLGHVEYLYGPQKYSYMNTTECVGSRAFIINLVSTDVANIVFEYAKITDVINHIFNSLYEITLSNDKFIAVYDNQLVRHKIHNILIRMNDGYTNIIALFDDIFILKIKMLHTEYIIQIQDIVYTIPQTNRYEFLMEYIRDSDLLHNSSPHGYLIAISVKIIHLWKCHFI